MIPGKELAATSAVASVPLPISQSFKFHLMPLRTVGMSTVSPIFLLMAARRRHLLHRHGHGRGH